eukprot:132249-Pyramimonas_sp.AAC.1
MDGHRDGRTGLSPVAPADTTLVAYQIAGLDNTQIIGTFRTLQQDGLVSLCPTDDAWDISGHLRLNTSVGPGPVSYTHLTLPTILLV